MTFLIEFLNTSSKYSCPNFKENLCIHFFCMVDTAHHRLIQAYPFQYRYAVSEAIIIVFLSLSTLKIQKNDVQSLNTKMFVVYKFIFQHLLFNKIRQILWLFYGPRSDTKIKKMNRNYNYLTNYNNNVTCQNLLLSLLQR